jgi:hypothetical protein
MVMKFLIWDFWLQALNYIYTKIGLFGMFKTGIFKNTMSGSKISNMTASPNLFC